MTRTIQDLRDDMAAFDALPRAVRDVINEARYSFSVDQIVEQLGMVRKVVNEEAAVEFMVKFMIEAERAFVAPGAVAA